MAHVAHSVFHVACCVLQSAIGNVAAVRPSGENLYGL
jgi:hypothetical protein